MPKALYIAFALVIVGGLVFYLFRDQWLASRIFSDISDSTATVVKNVYRDENNRQVEKDINDGLDDRYGIVQFRSHADSVAKLLSECEENPASALKIFRRCMDEGGKNARMIAMYSVFYLAGKSQLDKSDIERIASRVDAANEKDVEIRKVAQRTLGDLILIKDASAKSKYETVPDNVAKSEGDWPSPRIETLEEDHKGTKHLRVRWSNPDTAAAWWKQHGANGSWSAADQAWVLP